MVKCELWLFASFGLSDWVDEGFVVDNKKDVEEAREQLVSHRKLLDDEDLARSLLSNPTGTSLDEKFTGRIQITSFHLSIV